MPHLWDAWYQKKEENTVPLETTNNVMDLEPSNLNIQLARKNYLVLKIIGFCILVSIISAFINQTFSIVFSACAIVASPLLAYIFSPTLALEKSLGGFGRILAIALAVGYLAFAKSFLIPAVIAMIEKTLA